jgi:hypothetical protein
MRRAILPVLTAASFFIFGVLSVLNLEDSTRVVREYEDGSGVLSDGRTFCIHGELCEER